MFYSFYGFVLIAALTEAVLAYSIEDESQLQTDLLTGYNVNVRPSKQVQVRCVLLLRNLLSLDTVDQSLAVTGSLYVLWNDHRLSWNESQNGNVSNVYYKSDQIWRPTLVLQNSVTGIEVIGDNGNQKSIPMSVGSAGGVFWLAPAYFISYCTVDISKFPFDTQTCELVISGWMYSSDSMKLIHLSNEIFLEEFEENGEYDVIRSYTRIDGRALSTYPVEYLVFGIELRRKYSYYLINVVLPIFFLQLLGLVVFLVPTESGEKLTFSLTILLSLTVMMTLIAEKIPTTSLQIPTLSIYMLGGAVISSLELIMTVIILHLRHHNKEETPVSRRMHSIAIGLAVLTCKKRNKIDSETDVITTSANNGCLTVVEVKEVTSKAKKDFDEVDQEDICPYTYEDIALMMDTFSLILFSTVTIVFTFAILVIIL